MIPNFISNGSTRGSDRRERPLVFILKYIQNEEAFQLYENTHFYAISMIFFLKTLCKRGYKNYFFLNLNFGYKGFLYGPQDRKKNRKSIFSESASFSENASKIKKKPINNFN